MKLLYSDEEGRSTILFKMAPGAVVPLHEHTALEQTYMLEGSLEDAEGACGAGDFVWRPGGNVHVAHAPGGATFLAIFNRPNRFFDGTKFFTEAAPRCSLLTLSIQVSSGVDARAQGGLAVVPANAGTHTPRRKLCEHAV